jgi:hypothetical protein
MTATRTAGGRSACALIVAGVAVVWGGVACLAVTAMLG